MSLSVEELREICTLTIELTRLRQRGCAHLCIENFAPKLFTQLCDELAAIKARPK